MPYLQELCDINARNMTQLTPLHLALQEGQIEAVERLIGYGADLNYKTRDGNTPLHIALGRNNMRKPSERTPQIKKVEFSDRSDIPKEICHVAIYILTRT